MKTSMTFSHFETTNYQRSLHWHEGAPWTISDWAVAMAGECGEACNVVKKLNRVRDGNQGNEETEEELINQLGHEIADTICYAFLLANWMGINVEEALIEKFNLVSDKHGFPEHLDSE